MNISKFHRLVLSWIFDKSFSQGFHHYSNLVEVYGLIRKSLDEEFTEDNAPTLDYLTKECFNRSLKYDLINLKENNMENGLCEQLKIKMQYLDIEEKSIREKISKIKSELAGLDTSLNQVIGDRAILEETIGVLERIGE